MSLDPSQDIKDDVEEKGQEGMSPNPSPDMSSLDLSPQKQIHPLQRGPSQRMDLLYCALRQNLYRRKKQQCQRRENKD